MLSGPDGFKGEFGRAYLVNLKCRDPQTEAHFATYFSGYLESKLRCQLRSRDVAEDICQETLFRGLEAVYTKGDLRRPERFGAFVNSVCNNVLLEHWRRKKTGGETLDLTEQTDGGRNPEIAAQVAQEVANLRNALLKLKKRDRDLLRMIYWEERERHEVSSITNMSAEHVRVMLHRAKRAIRRYLDESRGRAMARLSGSPPSHSLGWSTERRPRYEQKQDRSTSSRPFPSGGDCGAPVSTGLAVSRALPFPFDACSHHSDQAIESACDRTLQHPASSGLDGGQDPSG